MVLGCICLSGGRLVLLSLGAWVELGGMFLGSVGNPIQDMGVRLAVLSRGFLEELCIL